MSDDSEDKGEPRDVDPNIYQEIFVTPRIRFQGQEITLFTSLPPSVDPKVGGRFEIVPNWAGKGDHLVSIQFDDGTDVTEVGYGVDSALLNWVGEAAEKLRLKIDGEQPGDY